jgi:hypothetical protein
MNKYVELVEECLTEAKKYAHQMEWVGDKGVELTVYGKSKKDLDDKLKLLGHQDVYNWGESSPEVEEIMGKLTTKYKNADWWKYHK